MRFIDAEEVHRRLDYPGLIAALESAHREAAPEVARLMMSQASESGGEDHFLMLPAWSRGQALGIKVVSIFPDNWTAGRGLPTIQALYLLFDGRDGRPLATVDGTALTYRKTAADSALGAKLLARHDVESLLMVGAGDLAPYMIAAHLAARPSLRHIRIWNRGAPRAAALAERLEVGDREVAATTDLEGSAREADLICCATRALEPLILGAWLKPGTHLDLVGGYTPEMREADDEAARRARVFVDSRWYTRGEVGDIDGPIAAGAMSEADILADLFQLCGGDHPGRRDESEITFFKNGGGAHLDLMTARYLLAQAKAQAEAS